MPNSLHKAKEKTPRTSKAIPNTCVNGACIYKHRQLATAINLIPFTSKSTSKWMIVCLLYFAVYLLICLITSVSMVAIQQLPVDSDTKINTKTGQEISGTWCTARWSTWTNNYQMEEAMRRMSCIFCEMIDEWIYILYKYYTVAYWFYMTNHSS